MFYVLCLYFKKNHKLQLKLSFFSKSLGNRFNAPHEKDEVATNDIHQQFARLEPWTRGQRFVDADPQYSDVIKSLPTGEATSMRLSESPGTISVTGEHHRVFGYPGTLEFNMPAITELSGTARILLDLGYSGVEQEAQGIAHDIMNKTYGMRISYLSLKTYPLLRLQISFYSYLQEPLHLEVLSDILDRNVQDFYTSLYETGNYELSVHVTRKHLGSVFSSVTEKEQNDVYRGISGVVSRLEALQPSDRDMDSAVREFERRHPLGEGM